MAGMENIRAVVDGVHVIDIAILIAPDTLIEIVESRTTAGGGRGEQLEMRWSVGVQKMILI